MNFQMTLIAGILAAALGFGAGFYTKGEFTQAGEVKQVHQDAKQAATNVIEATKASTTLDASVAADGASIDKIKEAAAQRVVKYQPKPESIYAARSSHGAFDGIRQQPENQIPAAAGQPLAQVDCHRTGFVLDSGTVRLLNAAAEGAGVGAAGSRNGQEPAAAGPAR